MQRADLLDALAASGSITLVAPALNASLAAGASRSVVLEMPSDGVLIDMAGTTEADGSAAGLASIGVQLQDNEGNFYFMNGIGAEYVTLAELCGTTCERRHPLGLRVKAGMKFTITVWNFGSGAYKPRVSFRLAKG